VFRSFPVSCDIAASARVRPRGHGSRGRAVGRLDVPWVWLFQRELLRGWRRVRVRSGYDVAFQGFNGDLFVGSVDQGGLDASMMAGTSPSICALPGGAADPGGGWAVAYQATTTDLWVVGTVQMGT
jgi:hypothetical protein